VPRARRFALVTTNFYPRVCGIGDFSARFGAELLRRGHEVAVFSRGPVAPNPEAPEVEARVVEGHLPSVIARNLAEALRAYRPTDVLIQYTAQMWDAWRFGTFAPALVAWQARRAGARVSLFAHELFFSFDARPDLAVAAAAHRLELGALLALCDSVYVTTGTRAESIREACRWLGARPPGVMRIGANAVPVERRRPPGPPRLGIFSTAAAGKRFDVVLEAFERVAREVPDAELVLIGALGPPERPLVRRVLDDVARHPAKDRIRLTGGLPLPEASREIADLDVYLFPMSTGANTRSGTLPAALGARLATIATRGDETDRSLFLDGENIVFAREMSGAAFAEAALGLLRDPGWRARVAAGARRLYDEHLSWEATVERFLAAGPTGDMMAGS
jgi:glycosyltransferase involved in cell wall biosynthesis